LTGELKLSSGRAIMAVAGKRAGWWGVHKNSGDQYRVYPLPVRKVFNVFLELLTHVIAGVNTGYDIGALHDATWHLATS
jgi:hypothetical protein